MTGVLVQWINSLAAVLICMRSLQRSLAPAALAIEPSLRHPCPLRNDQQRRPLGRLVLLAVCQVGWAPPIALSYLWAVVPSARQAPQRKCTLRTSQQPWRNTQRSQGVPSSTHMSSVSLILSQVPLQPPLQGRGATPRTPSTQLTALSTSPIPALCSPWERG